MRLAPVPLLLALAACHAPSPSMMHAGVARQEIAVDGALWRVDWDGTVAEAHRLNVDMRLARGPMVMRGAMAIMLATGCGLRRGTLQGDQAIVRAGTDCDRPARLRASAPAPQQIACVMHEAAAARRTPEAVLTDCLVED